MNSSYRINTIDPDTLNDIMWLSDALHNLELIGQALLEPENEKQHIETLIMSFENYLQPPANLTSQPCDSFGRWDINIPAAIKIFESLIN